MLLSKKLKTIVFTILIVGLVGFLAGCSEESEAMELPQLAGNTVDAATMILVDAPPTKPTDHIDRWRDSLQENNCLPCHATGSGGATILPDSHYVNEDPTNEVNRTYCIQCHVEQRDDKPAFNRENE